MAADATTGPRAVSTPVALNPPFGGALVDLLVAGDAAAALRARAATLPSIQLTPRAVCDLELLATGAFSPLDRFMSRADYERVLGEMRLAGGHLFPIPVTLPVTPSAAVALDQEVALRDSRNDVLAVMRIEDVFEWSVRDAARAVFGTEDRRHPVVNELHEWGRVNVSGPLQVLRLPAHHDFTAMRLTPAETRARLGTYGRAHVVAFQTRNPLHRVHEELTKRAIAGVDGVLLLHPAVGLTRPGDVDHYTRVRTYRALAARHYDPARILLALLPLAMRMAGPREALWHALIRRNYGASHFIVGRDHASPGVDAHGRPFYDPDEAPRTVAAHQDELGIAVLPFPELVYLPDEDRYEEVSSVAPGTRTVAVSGSDVRREFLNRGRTPPAWLMRSEVAEILAEGHPPRSRQGVCVWFTGLSGSGKSTTAEILVPLLLEHGRQSTLLDGDVVRTHLSKGLGFTREDRDTNVRRIGFVAAEIVRHGGTAVCAAVSPYRAARDEVRAMVGADRFVEVFVDTPLEVCESRDAKGIYARARRGEISGLTGVDDPYEPPLAPSLTLETVSRTPDENARAIVAHLTAQGFLADRAAER